MTSKSNERVAGTLEEYRRATGLGRNTIYDAAKRGDIETIRVGRRLLVPRSEFERLKGGVRRIEP